MVEHRLPTRDEYVYSNIFSRRDKLYFVKGIDNGFAGSYDTKSEAERAFRNLKGK